MLTYNNYCQENHGVKIILTHVNCSGHFLPHSLKLRATKCDVIRPPAKANNRASGSKQLEYTAVNCGLLAVPETVDLKCSDTHPKYQYTS